MLTIPRVQVDWSYAGASISLKCDLPVQNVRIDDFATAMEWNVSARQEVE